MTRLLLHQPARYQIVIGSHAGRTETVWQPSFVVRHVYLLNGTPITRLDGVLADQAAQHGILAQIRDNGLPLYLVRCLDLGDFPDRQPEK